MTIEIDFDVEVSPGVYFDPDSSSFFVSGGLELSDVEDVELSPSVFFAQDGTEFFLDGALPIGETDSLVEFSGGAYAGPPSEVVYNGASRAFPDYLELIPVVLPGEPGDTGLEIDLLLRIVPDAILTLEDLMDLLTYAGDIRLALEAGEGALGLKQNDLERDATLETALLVSLFTDRRATVEQVKAAGMDAGDLRGWWGDEGEDEPTGSLLWLLGRAKLTPQTLAQARDYALQAWQWLIRDGAAERIDVTVERTAAEEMTFTVTVQRPRAAENVNFRWHYNWQAQQIRRG